MKLIAINDPHYAGTSFPACRSKKYGERILDKLREVGELCDKHGADIILCTGDWFHRKRVNFSEANKLIECINSLPVPVVTIFGNHDISGYNISSIKNRAAGTLVNTGAVKCLDSGPVILNVSSLNRPVHISGQSYQHGADKRKKTAIKYYGVDKSELGEEAFYIRLAHGTLLTDGNIFEDIDCTKFDKDFVKYMKDMKKDPDLIINGHLHFHQNSKCIDGVTAACMGSIARVSSDDLDRKPTCLLIDVQDDSFSIEEIELDSAKMDLEVIGNSNSSVSNEDIKDFVKLLKTEAESVEKFNHEKLISEIIKEKGYSDTIKNKVLKVLSSNER